MTQKSCELTAKQTELLDKLGTAATHVLAYGGSRSGKTFLIIRAIVTRALAATHSRHAILRHAFNHVKQSVVLDTFPKVMRLCFPDVEFSLSRTDWYAEFSNGSQIWFGGLDDKDRTEKILGMEFATIFLNEVSQIAKPARDIALTRLAQRVYYDLGGKKQVQLRLKMYYDENPPSQAHWTYALFVRKQDPDTRKPLANPEDYENIQLNPEDNMANLPPDYLKTLASLPARMRVRFLSGKFGSVTEGALWQQEDIDKWRVVNEELPDMQRILIAVDPSGADDVDNFANDEIGIIVGGLGVDGNAYILEDLTVKAGPKTWGNIVGSAFDRHMADKVIGEINFGGAMVDFVIQTARPRTPYEGVTASRGKAVRAEPVSALAEGGKVRMAGNFPLLEEEMCSFTTAGYIGSGSPNRVDAYVWLITAMFPSLTRKAKKDEANAPQEVVYEREVANVAWLAS